MGVVFYFLIKEGFNELLESREKKENDKNLLEDKDQFMSDLISEMFKANSKESSAKDIKETKEEIKNTMLVMYDQDRLFNHLKRDEFVILINNKLD